MTASRFSSPSSSLDLTALLRPLRRALGICLGLAVVLHLGVAALNPFEQTTQKTVRPMTTTFIKREPRLTKPLELRKVPQPRRQMLRRETRLAPARLDQIKATAVFDTRGLIAGHGSSASPISLPRQAENLPAVALDLEPTLPTMEIATTRTVEHRIDLALEMLDVHSMDTGRYRAMVIQDPEERQNLKGFIKFAHVMSASAVSEGTAGWGQINVREIDALRDAVNVYTGLRAEFIGSIPFDDTRLMEVPIIVLPQGTPNESEMEQLARYLLAGGFVLRSAYMPKEWENWGVSGYWEEALEKYGGLVKGQDFWSERLPDDHPIFRSFFDIKGGAVKGWGAGFDTSPSLYMNGYFIKGRLAGLANSTGWRWINESFVGDGDNGRNLQMAVNAVIFALTQEGGMTQRLMQGVK